MKTPIMKFAFIGLIAIAILGTSSCGQVDLTESTTSATQSDSLGTRGQLISIQSDNVQMAGYDADGLIMTVQFDNGSIYEYYGVSSDLWTAFLAAQPHPWSAVGYPRLVAAGVPYKRVS